MAATVAVRKSAEYCMNGTIRHRPRRRGDARVSGREGALDTLMFLRSDNPPMKRTLPLLLVGVAILYSSPMRAAIPDTVKTDAGQLSGTVQEGVRVFKGVPF